MSIYRENIKPLQFIRPFWRVLLNGYHMFRGGEKASKPFGIKFEVSSLCNLRCVMCPRSKGLTRKQGLLSFENFKKVYDQIKPAYLNLTGMGEPLLNPDLFRIIRYAKKNKSIVKIDTNATLLNEKNASKLLDTEPNIVSISIDGTDKRTFEAIRKGAKFEEVIENMKKLVKLRNSRKSNTNVHVNFVLQRKNISEISRFITYIDSLGVDSINGDIALPLGANKNIDNRKVSKETLEKLEKELKNLRTKASLNIEHVYEFIKCGGDIKNKTHKNCFYPWYYPSITWDGNVVPCCYICDNEIVFGNVFEEDFDKIWNNKKIREFRRMIAKERKGICKECFIDESYLADKLRALGKIPVINLISKRNI